MTWMKALREHNRGKGQWCMPRRGSAEHAHVRALMRGSAFTAPGPRAAGSRARASKPTRGEETFNKAIARIENSEALKKLAWKVRPFSRRDIM
jgi:hypothetical protein